MKWLGSKATTARNLLFAGLCLLIIAPVAIIGWRALPAHTALYTDSDTIRAPASGALLREILWQPATRVPGGTDIAVDEYEPRLSPDGQTLFFVRGKAGHNADIYFRRASAHGWTDPAPLEAINTDADELGPELSPDGQSLYFYSNREGGLGGYDIWVSRLSGDTWQPPVNLGPDVNSAFNEYGVAISPDGSTLYFSSNRPRAGEGAPRSGAWPATIREDLTHHDYDIYAATLAERTAGPARPVLALNSPFNEGAPAVSPAGDFLYFASDRPGGFGGFDIYRSRLRRMDGVTTVEAPGNLGSAINSASNDLDPALTMGGFAMYFSSDRGQSAAAPDTPAYTLYRSQSREVFREVETTRASIDWRSLLPFLWLLIFLLSIPLLAWLLARTGRSDGFRRLSLIAKCLLISLMIHALILLGFGFWKVGGAVAGVLRRTSGTRIAITSGTVDTGTTGAIATQLRSGLTGSSISSIPLPEPVRARFTTSAVDSPSTARAQINPGAARVSISAGPLAPANSDAPPPANASRRSIPDAPVPPDDFAKLQTPQSPAPAPTSEPPTPGLAQVPSVRGDAAARPAPPVAMGLTQSPSRATPPMPVPGDAYETASVRLPSTTDAPAPSSVSVSQRPLQLPVPTAAALTAALPAPATEAQSAPEAIRSISPAPLAATSRPRVSGVSSAGSVAPLHVPGGAPGLQATATPIGLPRLADAAPGIRRAEAPLRTGGVPEVGPAPAPSVELALPAAMTTGTAGTAPESAGTFSVPGAPSIRPDVATTEAGSLAGPVHIDLDPSAIPAIASQPFARSPGARADAPASTSASSQPSAPTLTPGALPALSLPSETATASGREPSANPGQSINTAIAAPPLNLRPAVPSSSPRSGPVAGAATPELRRVPSAGVDPLNPRVQISDSAPPTVSGTRSALSDGIPTAHQATALELALPTETTPVADPFAQRAPEIRQPLLERMGGGADTERAVNLALDWLSRHQSKDGRWSSTSFDDDCHECGGVTNIHSDAAVTGLALLCFLGADHTHIKAGPYQDNVDRALRWLIERQSADGDLRANETMYSQGIGAIALSEAFGMTHDATLRGPIERAVEFIGNARSKAGGWRYVPGQPGDTSVLGWQAMALASARRAGIIVPDELFRAASDWLDRASASGKPGQYCYQPGNAPSPSMTAEGLFVQQLLGRKRDEPIMLGSVAYISQHPPKWTSQANTYYWYYATLSLFQHQGSAWESWNAALKKQLLAHQQQDGAVAGSWDLTDKYSKVGGRVYQTAICTLCLEVYYRYLPMYGVQEP